MKRGAVSELGHRDRSSTNESHQSFLTLLRSPCEPFVADCQADQTRADQCQGVGGCFGDGSQAPWDKQQTTAMLTKAGGIAVALFGVGTSYLGARRRL